jgi:hypothetical protein
MKLIPILLVLAPFASAQVTELKFTEVLVDPVGVDAGRQVIEYQNTGNVDIDTSTWYLASGTTTTLLPKLTIPIGTIGRIHIGKKGVNSKADLYLPTHRTLSRFDSLAFFKSKSFSDPKALVDFVAWGGGKGYISIAVQANQWGSTFETVVLPKNEGHTIAHFMRDAYGRGNSATDWYGDGTPTLGVANDPGSLFNYGAGCSKMVGSPNLGSGRPEGRPWIGETWELDLYNLPNSFGTALVLFGLQPVTPIPLDSLGLTGCTLNLRINAILGVARNQGRGKLLAPLPLDAGLIGGQFYTQALIIDASYKNPARAAMTNMLIIKIGSR